MAKKKKDPPPEDAEEDVKDVKKAKGKGKGKADEADEAEATEGAEGEGEPKKTKLPLVKIAIFAGAPLLLIVIGVVAALMLGLFGGKHEAEEAHGEAPARPAANEVQFYDLPEILVNLNTGGKTETYLKLQVAIEIPKEADVAVIELALPRILDRFQVFLRELRLEDLNGSAGTYRLKQELLRRVHLSGLAVSVNDVLIREMIIQ